MQSAIPKQYLPLDGRPVIEHTLNTLLSSPHICGLVIALGEDDGYWDDIDIDTDKPMLRTAGGSERANSVLNAITALLLHHADQDTSHVWVMVHDAVRPCLRQSDIARLVAEVDGDSNGGILARPVRDTMKRQSANEADPRIDTTVDRQGLWHALTPQYFPARLLKTAIESMISTDPAAITDEASAMENAGYSPRLVTGYDDNIKITHPDDLRIASLFLQHIHTNDTEGGR
jgi:2-C-methyl-D-erythritol 4-phosphate cytidylyltransferase